MWEKIIETKNCKSCNSYFDITDFDLEFYKKVSPKFNGEIFSIPSPTLCPDCRQRRRQTFKNIYNLYKNEKKGFVSAISPDKDFNVIVQNDWWGDSDLWLTFGFEFDNNKSFFTQFKELQKKAPRWNLIQVWCENCEWSINVSNSKNCYLVKSWWENEDCYYWERVFNSTNTIDGVRIEKSVNCYDSYNLSDCYEVFFWKNIENGKQSMYVTDCKNVNNCIWCIWLNNKDNHILNSPMTKDEVKLYRNKILTDEKFREDFLKAYTKLINNHPVKALIIENCENSSWNELFNSKNVINWFDARDVENAKYSFDLSKSKDVMDVNWDDNGILSYESSTNFTLYNSSFCFNSATLTNCYYCETSTDLINCFGCVWIHNKSYCILNKQYTKDEYEKIVPQIIEKMIIDSQWWEFLPSSSSPYWYNESEAHDYFPLDKKIAINQGLNWSDYEAPFPKVEKIIKSNQLPNNIKDIPDDILNWAIECEITKKPFKIIKEELEFYRRYNFPIPKKHPDIRHRERLKLRNPRQLFDRECDKCNKKIKTTFIPGWKEVVYCEDCYDREMY